MTDIISILLNEESAQLSPQEINIDVEGEQLKFYLSYTAHMGVNDGPTHLMIEYRDIRQEMGELLEYERGYEEPEQCK